jgi:hypothetical protein
MQSCRVFQRFWASHYSWETHRLQCEESDSLCKNETHAVRRHPVRSAIGGEPSCPQPQRGLVVILRENPENEITYKEIQ